MRTPSLLDSLPIDYDWRPEAPPVLDSMRDIELDFETTGVKWWDGDEPIGVAIGTPDGLYRYLPWGHRGGGNLDKAVVVRWFREQVKHKNIRNHTTKFECHMARVLGIDLEAQGNTVTDVAHHAALLDDHRKRFALNELALDELGERKVDGLDKSRMASYHAGQVAAYAEQDVRLVRLLVDRYRPRLEEEGLTRVLELENELIYVVVEMERNGARLDVSLLKDYAQRAQKELENTIWKIYRDTGLRVSPDSSKDAEKLFRHLGIPITAFTPAGRPSFTADVLRGVDHPSVKDLVHAGKLADLMSKYTSKYLHNLGPEGILRYALHQLRAETQPGETSGTVSGRFSSTAIKAGRESYGANIQQVMAVDKQTRTYGADYIIRKLFVPNDGEYWLSADAAQIEYRIFAHYAASPKILAAYAANPRLKFHDLIWEMLRPHKRDLSYKATKNLNFAYIYGAGLLKMAVMLEFITQYDADMLRQEYAPRPVPKNHPALRQIVEVRNIYNDQIPEVAPLLAKASRLAEERGYVKTILGRRSRFPNKYRLHKALNAVIQGSAADIMKRKLVDLHKARHETGLKLWFTVHDEVDGSIPNADGARKVEAILNEQSFDMKVPILWDVETGQNWAECEPLGSEERQERAGVDATRGGRVNF